MSKEAVLNELNSQVGSLIHQSEWIDISQEKIDAFADATEDHQWIHIDPARAAEESPFKATIAHGYLLYLFTQSWGAGGSFNSSFSWDKKHHQLWYQ